MPYSLQGVAPDRLHEVWPKVAPLLANALSRGCRGYTLGDVHNLIQDGHVMLWLVTDGNIRAAVVSYPDERASALTVWLMGGDGMAEWLQTLIQGLERYARESGLSAIQAEVRPGLVRELKRDGWRPEFTTVRKNI